ncbi:hypothetical protein NIM87_13460 [Devosia sp. XJ19-1]|uniref:DNA-binding protein n=1 Tax=Devosia ureilytica TaxID=2952754 RepID=A0A9Q4AQV7_9HYPH|nr:hypothetical protein [Devosia ureilytica]MCP8884520.1 hypothetical protein [Devosia ureilytica]MCP8888150.1 hypothetical protein [Devosia ureilytica]
MSAATDRIADSVKLSRPAQRALAAAGIITFADLALWVRQDVADLHGIGPKSFVELEPAMSARGLSFKSP